MVEDEAKKLVFGRKCCWVDNGCHTVADNKITSSNSVQECLSYVEHAILPCVTRENKFSIIFRFCVFAFLFFFYFWIQFNFGRSFIIILFYRDIFLLKEKEIAGDHIVQVKLNHKVIKSLESGCRRAEKTKELTQTIIQLNFVVKKNRQKERKKRRDKFIFWS